MIKFLILVIAFIKLSQQQTATASTNGAIPQTIYQFLQTLPNAAKVSPSFIIPAVTS
jgi:hypothetical protein